MKLKTCSRPVNLRSASFLPLLLRTRGPGRGGFRLPGPIFMRRSPVLDWFAPTFSLLLLLLLIEAARGAEAPAPETPSTNLGHVASELAPSKAQPFGWRGDGT